MHTDPVMDKFPAYKIYLELDLFTIFYEFDT